MSESTDLAELLDLAREAAHDARALLESSRPAEIRSKGHARDLVTEWDVRSEETIRKVLERSEIPILAEEGGQTGTIGTGMRWLVDPIDGTVNFAHGLPLWSVSIALEDANHQVLIGVVCVPMFGWWFEATRGGGAFDDNRDPLVVSSVPQLDRSMLSTGFPYDRATNPDNNFEAWEHLQRRAGACRRLGCASLDLCLVARGWLDGYWERRLSPWDIAAGGLIVAEAGGTVTSLTGGPFDPHSGQVVATNGAIHQELLAELAAVPRTKTP